MTVNTIYRGVQGNSSAQFAIGDAFTTAQNNDDSLNITKPERITNVAALRLLDKTKINSAETNGYYTAGDGGHGEYWYDATDTTTADNSFTVIVGADGARWKLLSEDGEVNVKSFGAVGDGVTDDSVAIQAALNSGTLSVVIPDGTFLCDNLLMPATFGFVLRGNGVSSRLKQKSSANPLIRWSTASINYTEGYIKDLAFIGTNGGNNTINTAGVGGLTLQNLYFTDVPTGYSSVYVNGAAATYVHDTRLKNIQIYSNLAGSAGIRFGALVADTTLDGFVMNGGFTTDYCLLFDSGAVTVRVNNSHPYNAKINVMKMSGSNTNCGFTGVTFDNALSDIIHITSGSLNIFSNCHIQAVKSGYSGVILVNSSNNTLSNTMFDGAVGSLSCAVETGTSNGNIIVGGNINLAINFATPFSLIGAESYAKGLNGYADFGLMYSFTGCTSTAQAQNTTQFLGANGGQAAMNNTAFLVPHSTLVKTAYIAVVSTPAVGQTFTFNLKNGSTTIGTLVVSNGGFGGTITSNTAVSAYSQISIESIFSATSGSSDVRYSINMLS